MGIELIIGAISAAASIATGVMSLSKAKSATDERKKANKVASAQTKIDASNQRRKALREARVRRAMIMQQSVNSGLGTDGSGTQGSIGVIGTNIGISNAQSLGQSMSNEAINGYQNKASDYDFQSAMWSSMGNIFSGAVGGFMNTATQKPKKSIFDSIEE